MSPPSATDVDAELRQRLTDEEIEAALADPTIITDDSSTLTAAQEVAFEAALATFSFHRRLSSGYRPSLRYAVIAFMRALDHTIIEEP